jgi:hypothetical protein
MEIEEIMLTNIHSQWKCTLKVIWAEDQKLISQSEERLKFILLSIP